MASHNYNQNPFVQYDLDTTYVPPENPDEVDAVVPAVPEVSGADRPPSTVPAAAPPQAAPLQFTESTLNTNVTGKIGREQPKPSSDLERQSQPILGGVPYSAPAPGVSEDPASFALWDVRRYRTYFNVDTKDVLWRVTNSFLGPFKHDFMETTQDNPDLYGPFWVATTLVFVTAMASNFSDHIVWSMSTGQHPQASLNTTSIVGNQWYSDYRKVSYSALIFYGYIFVLGLALFFALKWFQSQVQLVNVWCIYGYSLSIFIPISFVCVVPISGLQWGVVVFATATSGLFLLANFKAVIFEAAPAKALLVLAAMAVCHVGMGLALKLYFFSYKTVETTTKGT